MPNQSQLSVIENEVIRLINGEADLGIAPQPEPPYHAAESVQRNEQASIWHTRPKHFIKPFDQVKYGEPVEQESVMMVSIENCN